MIKAFIFIAVVAGMLTGAVVYEAVKLIEDVENHVKEVKCAD